MHSNTSSRKHLFLPTPRSMGSATHTQTRHIQAPKTTHQKADCNDTQPRTMRGFDFNGSLFFVCLFFSLSRTVFHRRAPTPPLHPPPPPGETQSSRCGKDSFQIQSINQSINQSISALTTLREKRGRDPSLLEEESEVFPSYFTHSSVGLGWVSQEGRKEGSKQRKKL